MVGLRMYVLLKMCPICILLFLVAIIDFPFGSPLGSPPVSALSNTDGVDDEDGEESALVPFLSAVGSNATGNLIKCSFVWGTLTM